MWANHPLKGGLSKALFDFPVAFGLAFFNFVDFIRQPQAFHQGAKTLAADQMDWRMGPGPANFTEKRPR